MHEETEVKDQKGPACPHSPPIHILLFFPTPDPVDQQWPQAQHQMLGRWSTEVVAEWRDNFS